MRYERSEKRVSLIELVICLSLIAFAVLFYRTHAFGLLRVYEKEALGDYQWGELKAIAVMIADADTDEAAINIAHQYGLCDEEGRIYSDCTKAVHFGDGSGQQQVRIIGFRHDTIDGERKAGITFCFCGGFDTMCMYYSLEEPPSPLGWEQSGARFRLSECSHVPPTASDKLDSELSKVITKVQKSTMAYDYSSSKLSSEQCKDRLFLLSYSEVYGKRLAKKYSKKGIYTPVDEGNQYQLFRETEVRDLSQLISPPQKGVWLRSHATDDPYHYLAITSKGSVVSRKATTKRGALVGFCL